jgi:uncharacterized membrane protein YfcA
MESILLAKTALLGVITGFIGGLTGSSGSGMITSGLLILEISKDMKSAVGTTLATTMIPIALGSVYTYYQRKQVDVRVAIVLIICMASMMWVGAYCTKYMSNTFLKYFTSIYCLALGVFFFCSAYFDWR